LLSRWSKTCRNAVGSRSQEDWTQDHRANRPPGPALGVLGKPLFFFFFFSDGSTTAHAQPHTHTGHSVGRDERVRAARRQGVRFHRDTERHARRIRPRHRPWPRGRARRRPYVLPCAPPHTHTHTHTHQTTLLVNETTNETTTIDTPHSDFYLFTISAAHAHALCLIGNQVMAPRNGVRCAGNEHWAGSPPS
jgi:hypothetical protein